LAVRVAVFCLSGFLFAVFIIVCAHEVIVVTRRVGAFLGDLSVMMGFEICEVPLVLGRVICCRLGW